MKAVPEPRVQHSSEWYRQIAMEWGLDQQRTFGRCTFRSRTKPAEHGWTTGQELHKRYDKLEEYVLAVADRKKNASKIWTTVASAVYEGDVPIMLTLGLKTTGWRRSRAS